MDFRLSEEQAFIKNTIRRFMQRECPRDKAHEMDELGIFPGDLLEKLASLGFCGLTIPETYDGGALPVKGPGSSENQGLFNAILILEEIGTLSLALAGSYASVVFFGGHILTRFGSDAQRQALLPAAARGELIFGPALYDELSSDPLRFRSAGGEYTLNGCAEFVPLAGRASYLLIQAQGSSELDHSMLFLTGINSPGVRIDPIESSGQRGAAPAQVFFTNVPASPLLFFKGESEDDDSYLRAINDLVCAGLGLGLAQGAFGYAAQYASERAQFGQPILQFEAIQHMLVDQSLALQSTRWLLYHTCWLADQGEPFSYEAALACLQAKNLAHQAGLQGVHILGGYGYMAEYDAQRYMRDSLRLIFASENSENLKNRIGEKLWKTK
jgi:alkylation response protein AidB-like acyl-CoA dehydrogenase